MQWYLRMRCVPESVLRLGPGLGPLPSPGNPAFVFRAPVDDRRGLVVLRVSYARSARKLSTASLNTLSPTAFM